MPIQDDELWDRKLSAVRARIAKLENLHTRSVEKWERTIDELVRLKTEEEALLIFKAIVINAFSRIVSRTPVDTGRARASWQFGVGVEPKGVAPEGEHPEMKVQGRRAIRSAIAEELEKIEAAPAGVLWYIANHLEYIEALEAGSSKQTAPYGMLGLTLNELRNELRRKLEL